jgi:hypothetical protein
LASASDGIKTIAGSILTGKAAPASARDQVGEGLKTALSALQNVTGEYFSWSNDLIEGTQAVLKVILTMRCRLELTWYQIAIEIVLLASFGRELKAGPFRKLIDIYLALEVYSYPNKFLLTQHP